MIEIGQATLISNFQITAGAGKTVSARSSVTFTGSVDIRLPKKFSVSLGSLLPAGTMTPGTNYRMVLENDFSRDVNGNQSPSPVKDPVFAFQSNEVLKFISFNHDVYYSGSYLKEGTDEGGLVLNNKDLRLISNRIKRASPDLIDWTFKTGTIRLLQVASPSNILLKQYNANPLIDGTVGIVDGSDISITVLGLLRSNTTYLIEMDPELVKDLDGFENAAFPNPPTVTGIFTTSDVDFPEFASDFLVNSSLEVPESEILIRAEASIDSVLSIDIIDTKLTGTVQTLNSNFTVDCDADKFTGVVIFQPMISSVDIDTNYLLGNLSSNISSSSSSQAIIGNIKPLSANLSSTFTITKNTIGKQQQGISNLSTVFSVSGFSDEYILSSNGTSLVSHLRTGINNWTAVSNNFGNNIGLGAPQVSPDYRHWAVAENTTTDSTLKLFRKTNVAFTTKATGTTGFANTTYNIYDTINPTPYGGVNCDGTFYAVKTARNSITIRKNNNGTIIDISDITITAPNYDGQPDLRYTVTPNWNPVDPNVLMLTMQRESAFGLGYYVEFYRKNTLDNTFVSFNSISMESQVENAIWTPNGDGILLGQRHGLPLGLRKSFKYYEKTGTNSFALRQNLDYHQIMSVLGTNLIPGYTKSNWHPNGDKFASASAITESTGDYDKLLKVWGFNKSTGLSLITSINLSWINITAPTNNSRALPTYVVWSPNGDYLIVKAEGIQTARMYKFENNTLTLIGTLPFNITVEGSIFWSN